MTYPEYEIDRFFFQMNREVEEDILRNAISLVACDLTVLNHDNLKIMVNL